MIPGNARSPLSAMHVCRAFGESTVPVDPGTGIAPVSKTYWRMRVGTKRKAMTTASHAWAHPARGAHMAGIASVTPRGLLGLVVLCGLVLSCRSLEPDRGHDLVGNTPHATSADLVELPPPLTMPTLDEPTAGPPRPVFRHAVVPGGVFSREEVWEASLRWPEVEAHYSRVDLAHLDLTRSRKNTRAYVSYKKNGQIFWTSYAVTIPAGEPVLSDGTASIRARCGNQISETPQSPVRTDEPSPVELDTPEPEAGPVSLTGLSPKGDSRSFWFPIFWPPHRSHHSSKEEPNPRPSPVVPEWPSWCYIGFGLAVMLSGYAFSRWKRPAGHELDAAGIRSGPAGPRPR
jgi:hypothetical protein